MMLTTAIYRYFNGLYASSQVTTNCHQERHELCEIAASGVNSSVRTDVHCVMGATLSALQ
jgi:hypothetical protein